MRCAAAHSRADLRTFAHGSCRDCSTDDSPYSKASGTSAGSARNATQSSPLNATGIASRGIPQLRRSQAAHPSVPLSALVRLYVQGHPRLYVRRIRGLPWMHHILTRPLIQLGHPGGELRSEPMRRGGRPARGSRDVSFASPAGCDRGPQLFCFQADRSCQKLAVRQSPQQLEAGVRFGS